MMFYKWNAKIMICGVILLCMHNKTIIGQDSLLFLLFFFRSAII